MNRAGSVKNLLADFLQKGRYMTKEKQRINAEEVVSNLSDFALFLTVMKNREAYRNTLSIIMDEPEIEIEQVKVEEVILNKSGKRAIRLDAWAKTKDQRIFDMEMQNEGHQDSMPKRSRYYQGMLDRPLLRSGKRTRYTFTEQCEEVAGLKLDDGITKIFLNMTIGTGSDCE